MPQRIIFSLFFVIAIITNAAAQEATTSEQPGKVATTTTTTTASVAIDTDSAETREALQAVLNRYPPQVSKVLKLDPALFSNSTYLANYPALATFIQQHPEIAHTPAFYLESIWVPSDLPIETNSMRMWRSTVEAFSIFTVMIVVTGSLIWLIRTLIEHRRWSRLTRTQAEVHNKLMDRFTSSEELLTYIQTPGGKRFLESAPIAMESGSRAVSAPIGRILWSVQIGLILLAGGFGMQFVSRSIEKDVAPPLLAMGVLAVAVGIGFLVSSFASFILSKRLGLLGPAASADAPALSE
jgi:hypothetical protein